MKRAISEAVIGDLGKEYAECSLSSHCFPFLVPPQRICPDQGRVSDGSNTLKTSISSYSGSIGKRNALTRLTSITNRSNPSIFSWNGNRAFRTGINWYAYIVYVCVISRYTIWILLQIFLRALSAKSVIQIKMPILMHPSYKQVDIYPPSLTVVVFGSPWPRHLSLCLPNFFF